MTGTLQVPYQGATLDFASPFRRATMHELGREATGADFSTFAPEEGPAAARLTFRSCLYADVFAKEGAPSLTRFACCQTDRLWLEGAQYRGVDARLSSSIGAGDDACCFVVTRVGG